MFTVGEILKITGGSLLFGELPSQKFTISTDTRKISAENIYLPIIGEKFDGHNFIQNALDCGCFGYITNSQQKIINNNAKFAIEVEDTLIAYLQIANYYRQAINPKVIAITGSSGKTTVKEMMSSVIETQFNLHKSQLNFNNEIGLCQTLLSMPANTEIAVVEMGMRGLGEIELLSKYAQPDISIITNVGTAHLGRLGSVENIAKAKCEVAFALKEEGLFIAPNDGLIKQANTFEGRVDYVDFSQVSSVEIKQDSSKFVYKTEEFELSITGMYNIENACLVIDAAIDAGVSIENIKKGLKNFSPIGNRWNITQIENNIKIINDSYNANPNSMMAAIKAFDDAFTDGAKILVLGDMGELGDDAIFYHSQVAEFINNQKINADLIVTVGDISQNISHDVKLLKKFETKSFMNNIDAVQYLKKRVKPNSVVFLKASRSMKFEEIEEGLKAE